jgi:hypothetical protein
MLRRRGWLTLLKAFERLTAVATVQTGGRQELKPVVIWCASGSRAVTVECPSLKPCNEGMVVKDPKM